MIVQGPAGRHASTLAEKEALVRLSLTAPHSPWVSVFRVGAACARGSILAWFPCTLLVSAVHGSRRSAMEYRCWQPETTPVFDRQEARRRFAEFIEQLQPGAWISRNSAGLSVEDRFLRNSRVLWDPEGDNQIQATPVYFPPTAPVPGLHAARTIRAFCRSGQRANHVPWIPAPSSDVTSPIEPARLAVR